MTDKINAEDVLAELTGLPREHFSTDEYEIPESLNNLESVSKEEWKDE